jgi:Aspartyl protease
MPAIHVNIAPGGPLLVASIHISVPRMQALNAAGQPAPTGATTGTFLLDTGASCTCVDPGLLTPLGLTPTGRVMISTPSTAGQPHHCNQYDISIFIPGAVGGGGHLVPALAVVETHLRSQGIDGLIGRDVLDNCTFIYNGSAKMFTLAY